MFLAVFEPTYRRVNKSGNRNLRCFPSHSTNQHNDYGFCGQPVIFYCPVVVPGTTFTASFVLKDSPLVPFALGGDGVFPGEITRDNRVVFNRELRGWEYTWTSSRHTATSLHCLRVCVNEPGHPLIFVDSAPFIVSAFRNREDMQLKSPGALSEPVRIIFGAIRDRLDLNETEELAWDAVETTMVDAASDGGWTDDFEAMDDADVNELVSLDMLDATLARTANFIHERFASFHSVAELCVALGRFLQESESTTVGALTQNVQRLLGVRLEPARAAATTLMLGVDDFFASALRELADMLQLEGSSFVPEFNAHNDVSGAFQPGPELGTFVNSYRSKTGWSTLERSIHKSYVSSLRIEILGPRHGTLYKAGGSEATVGLVSTKAMFTLGIPAATEVMAAGVFHNPWGGVGCAWAHSRGICFVMGGDYSDQGARMVTKLSRADDKHPGALVGCYRLQSLIDGAWRTVERVDGVVLTPR